jgi:hypothetical protein
VTGWRAAGGCWVLGALAMLPGCRSDVPTTDGTDQAPPTMGSAATALAPVDHLAPGELLEGSEHAYGLTFPQGLHVDDTFATEILASGPLALHPLVQYFQGRLKGGGLHEGTTSATFEDVKASSDRGPPLTIHITQVRDSVRVDLHDTTPPPAAPPLPDDAARWKHVGLTPTGRIADPTHLD